MILVRQRVPLDDRLIYSSWLWSSFQAFKEPQTAERYRERRELIAKRIANGSTFVVCPEADTNTILGWLCAHGNVLDYCYTRNESRREGICRMLCEKAFGGQPFTCINPTPRFASIAHKLGCMTREQETAWEREAK